MGLAVPAFLLSRVWAGGANVVITAILLLGYNLLLCLLLGVANKGKTQGKQQQQQQQQQPWRPRRLTPLLVSNANNLFPFSKKRGTRTHSASALSHHAHAPRAYATRLHSTA